MPKRIKLLRLSTINDVRLGFFSPDGKVLGLVGSEYVEVTETITSRRVFRISRAGAVILGAKFSPNRRYLAIAERSSAPSQNVKFKVTLWDAASGKEKISLPVVGDVWYRNIEDISFSVDMLASNLGGIPRLWRTDDGTEAKRFLPSDDKELSSERVLLSPDGNLLAVYLTKQNPVTNLVRVWNVATGDHIDLDVDVYRDWEFSTDSKRLAVTATQRRGLPGEHSAVEVWDVINRQRIKIIEVPKAWRSAYTLSFSPDSSMIAIGGYKKFGLFSATTGELVVSAMHPSFSLFSDNEIRNELNDIEFSPDGKMLLTGGNDGNVNLWRLSS